MDAFSSAFEDAWATARKTEGEEPMGSVYDVLGHFGRYPHVMWTRLLQRTPNLRETAEREVGKFKFPGPGQRDTPVCTKAVARRMVELIPSLYYESACTRAGVQGKSLSKRDAEDTLYVIRYSYRDDCVKIGRSDNPERRRRTLESGQPFRAEIVATFPGSGGLESTVHEALSAKRNEDGAGREWFNVTATEAIAVINAAIEDQQ
jgi:Meiotically up-regulated gene 113